MQEGGDQMEGIFRTKVAPYAPSLEGCVCRKCAWPVLLYQWGGLCKSVSMNEKEVCSQTVVATTVSGQKLPCASLITHPPLNLFYRHSWSTHMSHLTQDCGILSCGRYIYVYLLNAKALWSETGQSQEAQPLEGTEVMRVKMRSVSTKEE